ncbi:MULTISPECIES: hypothetical protein [unclassified Streptomyces]|uniref:hypothetical protein n=1 Tax=unclassified Streptomyces TaxID=2593676 RepID=UPI003802D72A
MIQAQSGIDKLSVRMDERRRVLDGIKGTVGELTDSEPLLEIPPTVRSPPSWRWRGP